jgi:hypothetical protein
LPTLVQRSFAGGEISPSLYARVDVSKYQNGLRTLRNYFVMRHGGAANRPGTKFVGEVNDSTKNVRLIPFVFNNEQTYVLEFGDLYMRVIKNGAQVVEATKTITDITNANPAVVTTSAAHGYSTGDEVVISGVSGGMDFEVNDRNFKITVTSATEFSLQFLNGSNYDSTASGSYVSGGFSERVYKIDTPYLEADLSTLHYVQSADVITIAHPNYAPRELARTADTSWTLSEINIDPSIDRPTDLSASASGSGNGYFYVVTAVKKETYEESYIAKDTSVLGIKNISAITNANPAVVTTSAAHGISLGSNIYQVLIENVGGMTELNGKAFVINVLTGTTFQLVDVDSTNFGTYTSGGTSTRLFLEVTAGTLSTSAPVTLSWTAVSGAEEYNVYKSRVVSGINTEGVYGFIGVSKGTSFKDVGYSPDITDNPPLHRYPFESAGDYPSTVTYFQQRRMFANTNNDPEKIWASKSGQFTNFTNHSPIQADDSLTFNLAARQVNSVKHMVDLGKLVVLTQGGEWAVNGDGSGTITPTDINARQYSYNGSSDLQPLIVGGTGLYVQARGSLVRDLDFDYTVDGYRGVDLTIYSSHLVDGHTIVDWAYAQVPQSIVWAVREDGVLLGLTYVKDQQMLAWHRHDTDGTIENVCVVPEGNEDVLYWVVKRTIDGTTRRYIERMNTRFVDETAVEDVTILDSYSTYDGRNTSATTMTLSGSGWTYEDTLTLTASASFFTSLDADLNNEIHLTGSDGTKIRCKITAYTSGTVVSVTPHKTVPVSMRSVAMTTWAKAINQVYGLWYLEGEYVSVFADGFVVSNPNNSAYTLLQVIAGNVLLQEYYSVIHIGLPITSDIETLNIDSPQGETVSDKHMIVSGVSLFVEKTRGLWVGGSPPPDETTDFLGGLTEIKVRSDESYDEPVALTTGVLDVNIESTWNSNGRVFIRNTDPVPASILAIAPAGLFPFRG